MWYPSPRRCSTNAFPNRNPKQGHLGSSPKQIASLPHIITSTLSPTLQLSPQGIAKSTHTAPPWSFLASPHLLFTFRCPVHRALHPSSTRIRFASLSTRALQQCRLLLLFADHLRSCECYHRLLRAQANRPQVSQTKISSTALLYQTSSSNSTIAPFTHTNSNSSSAQTTSAAPFAPASQYVHPPSLQPLSIPL